MNDETEDLRAEIAELRRRNDELSASLVAIERRLAASALAEAESELIERRRALRLLAGAAAVGAGAAVAMASSNPAAAAPGTALVEGDNTPTVAYHVEADLSGDALFVNNFGGGSAITAQTMNTTSEIAAINGVGIGRGVEGRAVGLGVYGSGIVGVRAEGSSLVSGDGVGIVASGARANARFIPGGVEPFFRRVGPGQSEAHFDVGDLAVDASGAWWIAVESGTAQRAFRMVGSPTSAGALTLIQPIRLFDSRLTRPIISGEERFVMMSGDIPGACRAVHVNLTVTNTVNSGFLSIYAGDGASGGTSAINWKASNQDIANALPVAIGNNGIRVRCGGSNSTDFIIDVYGYYR